MGLLGRWKGWGRLIWTWAGAANMHKRVCRGWGGARHRKMPTAAQLGSSPVRIDSQGNKDHGGGDLWSLTGYWLENDQKRAKLSSRVVVMGGLQMKISMKVIYKVVRSSKGDSSEPKNGSNMWRRWWKPTAKNAIAGSDCGSASRRERYRWKAYREVVPGCRFGDRGELKIASNEPKYKISKINENL